MKPKRRRCEYIAMSCFPIFRKRYFERITDCTQAHVAWPRLHCHPSLSARMGSLASRSCRIAYTSHNRQCECIQYVLSSGDSLRTWRPLSHRRLRVCVVRTLQSCTLVNQPQSTHETSVSLHRRHTLNSINCIPFGFERERWHGIILSAKQGYSNPPRLLSSCSRKRLEMPNS